MKNKALELDLCPTPFIGRLKMENLNILVACEESGTLTKEFVNLGFKNVFSADLIPTSGEFPDKHIIGDVLNLLNGNCKFKTEDNKHHRIIGKWDIIIGFPPCTFMSNAGACRMYPKKGEIDRDRLAKGLQAKDFFMKFYNADCNHIAIENPIPMKIIGLPEKTQVIQPYQHGHKFTKKTYLWLKNLPNLKPTNIVEPIGPYVCGNSEIWKKQAEKGIVYGKEKSSKHRSKTFPGIAKSMATQWSNYLLNKGDD